MDLLTRCVLVFEERGEAAVEQLLRGHPSIAAIAREQFAALQAAGLLVAPAPDPTSIGPYRIVRRLGTGGMGVVFLAEQEQPLRRQVAVKLIRAAMDTRQVLARFAVERQALASIAHPHVACIFDAGVTTDNRPYLVMEYVPGLPLVAWCDEHKLPLRARLDLFLRVCDAVQHAHHKGIIHRDLKPSNVLVVEHDGRPWPMVIDFGVAKSVAGSGGDDSLATRHGALLGTPEYMSPEQANGDTDLDTRADVYSLGVMLFELITGTLPIDSQRLRRHGTLEVARILRESEPPTPSHRITELGEGAVQCAENRGTDPGSLRRQLRGDLDWILLRALEKDRNRRYGMPVELAADLRRHLDDEPVMARPPGALYRLSKLVRRHRWAVTAVGFCLGSLVVGLVLSIGFAQQAEASAKLAHQNELTAAREAARARESEQAASAIAERNQAIADRLSVAQQTILDALDEMITFGMERLAEMPQSETLRRDLLQQALELHERLLKSEGENDPRLHYSLARTLAQVAYVEFSLGDPKQSLATLTRARGEMQQLPAASKTIFEVRVHEAALDQAEADLHSALRDQERAQTAAATARQRYEILVAEKPDDPQILAGVIGTMVTLAAVTEEPSMRRQWLTDAVPFVRRLLAGKPNNLQRSRGVAVFVDLAMLLVELGDPAAAGPFADEGEPALLAALDASHPLIQRLAFRGSLDRLAQVRYRTGRNDAARALMERENTLLRQATASFPLVPSLQNDLATSLANLGILLTRTGTRHEALALLDESLATKERLLAATPDDLVRREAVCMAAATVAANWLRWHRETAMTDGEVLGNAANRAIDLYTRLPEPNRRDRNLRTVVMQAMAARALHLHLRGERAPAIAACQAAVAFGAALVEQFPGLDQLQSIHADLSTVEAQVRFEQGDVPGALVAAERALQEFEALRTSKAAPSPRTRREATQQVARCRAVLGNREGALQVFAVLEHDGAAADFLAIAQTSITAAQDATSGAARQDWLANAAAALPRARALLAGDDDVRRRQRTLGDLLALRLRATAGDLGAARDGLDAATQAAAGDAVALALAASLANDLAVQFRGCNDTASAQRVTEVGLLAVRGLLTTGLPEVARLGAHPALAGLREAPGFRAALQARR